jgi:DNA-binding NtrC family response regulator
MAYILIIDDDEDFSNAAAIELAHVGHEVVEELSIAGGQQSLATRQPDILILDVMFPEDSAAGLKLAQSVHIDYPDLPIILLTAVNQEFPLGFSKKAIDDVHMPVADFLEKPIVLDTLSKTIANLLEKSK